MVLFIASVIVQNFSMTYLSIAQISTSTPIVVVLLLYVVYHFIGSTFSFFCDFFL